jgi:hypothetical protein
MERPYDTDEHQFSRLSQSPSVNCFFEENNARMIQLSSLMWAVAIFFGLIGFMRGWNREVVATAGIVLGGFLIFQFDSLLRGMLASVSRDQMFLVETGIFLSFVFIAYRTRSFVITRGAGRGDLQTNVLGALVGLINGYLIMGTLWYFLDINEYPLAPLVIAPGPGSPSDQARELLPLVILSGGISGSGDLLAGAV